VKNCGDVGLALGYRLAVWVGEKAVWVGEKKGFEVVMRSSEGRRN